MTSKITDIYNSDVRYMYEVEGKTQQEIADYYGVVVSTIHNRLHPEKKKVYNKQWMMENPEYKKQWYLEHPEYNREWRLDHPEYSKEYQLEHPECLNEWRRNTDKGRASVIKDASNRRSLGSIELNKSFPGSEGHHIDETYIIHIPKELHHSIYHNVWTGQGMEAINEIAFRYITEDTFDKLIGGYI